MGSYETLCELVNWKHFKNSLPERIATYISERKVKTAAEAASLADDFILAHGGVGPGSRNGHRDSCSASGSWSSQSG